MKSLKEISKGLDTDKEVHHKYLDLYEDVFSCYQRSH